MGFECHFDAVIFQNFLYWLRGPANVWNCAVASPGFCRVNYVLQQQFRLAGIQDEALGVPLDCNVDIIGCFSLLQSDFVVGIFSARSINDLTTACLCILGWCNEKDR